MAYSKLIKYFEKVRSYMRGFNVYGIWDREKQILRKLTERKKL